MNPIFWSVVGLDAALFLGLLISMLVQQGGSSNGGREMGIAFFVDRAVDTHRAQRCCSMCSLARQCGRSSR